eukprot:CAMPEP_0197629086 /NCGR_PEP_ID=MMETSP1338-20131121/7093_1 /TAXON_ID=43686 ORGANISM="Pelagodinium beii, Strain RCC1491" /NCGR_SAMPLE_ID=MMETSP1338 /ASSEMBLY_ACC=CAM_ASM_000754 /LENGTH=229 /DNA_ID=CAMNT_0043200093 /DNA_START=82 /DNA_END=771 /DNA_ORIENTATION=-
MAMASENFAKNLAAFDSLASSTFNSLSISSLDTRLMQLNGKGKTRDGSPKSSASAELNGAVKGINSKRSRQEPIFEESGTDSDCIPLHMTEEFLLGQWVDDHDSSIQVQWADDGDRLMATVCTPKGREIVLDFWQASDGSGWRCGEALLDANCSSGFEIRWCFPSGRTSTWWKMYEYGGADGVWWPAVPQLRDPVVDVKQLAYVLSGGATTSMMMPIQFQEEGVLFSAF